MGSLIADIKYTLATMRRDRGFAAAALVTLALGIGATTAVFSVVYGVLLRALPYPESERLVRLYEEHPAAPRPPGEPPLTNTTMYAWRARTETLEGLAAYYAREYTVSLDGQATRLHGAEVSAVAFSLLRARPGAGRFLSPSEETPRPRRVVVLSDRFWRDRFSRRADAIGGAMTIEGQPFEIIGVAEPGFHFPDLEAQIWTPYDDPTLTDPTVQGGIWLGPTLARLKPGATLAQVEAEGTTVARSIPRPAVLNMLFGYGGPVQVRAETLVGQMTSTVRPILVVLAAGVVLVLLVACANVASLFLSRGIARQRELALRAAIGASRGRLGRQLITESFVVSFAGGGFGLFLAWALMKVAPLVAPQDFPRLDAIRIDATVIVGAALATVLTAILSGAMPALRGARFDLAHSLHGGDGATAGGFRGARARRLRDSLLVVETALAALLLIGAALLGRSFARLMAIDAGYNPNNVLVARVYPAAGTPVERRRRFVSSVLDRVRADPRVVVAGAGNMMPFSDSTWVTGFTMPPSVGRGKPTNVRAVLYVVTPGYAEALSLRVREGRLLTAADAGDGAVHVLVNREFVHQYMSEGPVAGRTFAGGPYKAASTEIVGVVDDVLKDGNDTRALPALYALDDPAHPIQDEVDVVVRTAGDPAGLVALIRQSVRDADADAAVGEAMPLARRMSISVDRPRFAAMVAWLFAALALALASAGLYSVLSYTMTLRRRELGVRVALGAKRADLVRMVLREGLALTIGGLTAGIVAALGLTRLMSGLLFGVTPLDAASHLAAAAILITVAAGACLLPALRAASTDPAVALRN
jgi:predicted permease